MESNCISQSFEFDPEYRERRSSGLFSYKTPSEDSHEIGIRKSETRYNNVEPSLFDVKISLPSPISKEGFSVEDIMPSPHINRSRRNVGRILTYTAFDHENLQTRHYRSSTKPRIHKRSPSSFVNAEVTSKEILAALRKPQFSSKNAVGHVREISDVSCVVITSQDSEMFENYQTTAEKSFSNKKKSTISHLSTDLSMGPSSCMAFCGHCKNLVNSQISYKGNSLGASIFKVFKKMCCKAPEFIQNQVVHKCSDCGSVLGKV